MLTLSKFTARGTVMLRNELHTKKNEIEAAAAKYGAKHIRIFGSVARDDILKDGLAATNSTGDF